MSIGLFFSMMSHLFDTDPPEGQGIGFAISLIAAKVFRGCAAISPLIRATKIHKNEIRTQPIISPNGTVGLSTAISF